MGDMEPEWGSVEEIIYEAMQVVLGDEFGILENCRSHTGTARKDTLSALTLANRSSAKSRDMEKRLTVLERAFELARSGKCLNVSDILKRLKAERYDINQLQGVALKKQLTALIGESKC